MEIEANLGAGEEHETLLSGLKIWAKVGVELGEQVKKQAESNERLWRRLQWATPVTTRQVGSGVFPATGNLVITLGSPDAGTRWTVHSFALGGTDINVSATGKFGLYVSGYVASGFSPGMSALVDGAEWGATPDMPYTNQYGSDQIIINDQETIYVVVFGGTAGQTYMANICATVTNSAASLGSVVDTL
jgi:hypothetical protein